MAGGTWKSQNKIIPGVYINIKSAPATGAAPSERGIVALAEPLSWGPVGEIMTIRAGEDVTERLGYDGNTAEQTLFLRQLFLGTNRTGGASTVLLYRPAAADAAKATVAVGTGDTALTVTAAYPGVRGNDVSVSVEANPDVESGYTVRTAVSGIAVDAQTVTDLSQLKANAWVSFTGSGTPTASAAKPLVGGLDGTVAAAAYSAFLTALEPYKFDVLCYSGTESTVQDATHAFVKRLTEDEGRRCQAVMGGYEGADYEGVISVKNALVLPEKPLTAGQTAWWVAGCTAGADYNQSLTAAAHPRAVDVSPRLSTAETEAAISGGYFVLEEADGVICVVYDINTLMTYTQDKGKAFRKNRVIRALYTIANDIYAVFSKNYKGQVDNETYGHDLMKKEIVGRANEMQANRGVKNFTADDVTVGPGDDSDAIVVALNVQPVDSGEKIYVAVTVS